MKLISSFKDFWDWVIGKYGIDEKIVYERICWKRPVGKEDWKKDGMFIPYVGEMSVSPDLYVIALCGILYYCWMWKGKWYVNDEVEDMSDVPRGDRDYFSRTWRNYVECKDRFQLRTEINEKEDCPIVCMAVTADYKNIRLADFGLSSILDPEDTYIKICQFLTREPLIANSQTDIQRVQSHGFDKKTSFRKM